MKIPILDLKKQIAPIKNEIISAINPVIEKANFISGQEIANLENIVQAYTKANYAVAVSNGTDALKLALLALGVKAGEGVVCPSFTYFATAGAVVSMGGIPVFADINGDTFNMDGLYVEEAVKKNKKIKIKAVIPVHLYGQCCDMEAILKVARKYKLKVVEDTAQAFGAEFKGRKAGTMGDCGAISFFPGKNLGAFGDAGMVVTNNRSVADKLRILRNQGNIDRYHHLMVGYNHRMDTIQAAVLSVKLKYLDSWNRKRQKNAGYFNESFSGTNIKFPFVVDYSTHIYHQYVLRVKTGRDKLIEHLKEKGIDARIYYPIPLHLQKCFKYLGYKKGDFKESEKASAEVLAIPVYPELTKEELDYIVASIQEFKA